VGKLAGTSALSRIAGNLDCELQVAMALSGRTEPDFFKALTGSEFLGEYGERESARRRGRKFEENAYRYDAQALKEALTAYIGVDVPDVVVRNLEDDAPGSRELSRVRRSTITRNILRDLIAGAPVPHVLIQPQLVIPTGEPFKTRIFVAPDLLVLDVRRGIYEPGDLKSFVVRENSVASSDLERTRLQLGAAIIALRTEMAVHGRAHAVGNHGLMIFATAFGLRPHPYKREALDGAVVLMQRALEFMRRTALKLEAMREPEQPPIHVLAPDLAINLQERCVSACVLAQYCRRRQPDTVRELGDSAARMLGADTDINRLVALMNGAAPTSEAERAVAEMIHSGLARLGIQEVA
jgi:hypothetical protein